MNELLWVPNWPPPYDPNAQEMLERSPSTVLGVPARLLWIGSVSGNSRKSRTRGERNTATLLRLLEHVGDSQLRLSNTLWGLSVFSQVPVRFSATAAFSVGSSIPGWGFS